MKLTTHLLLVISMFLIAGTLVGIPYLYTGDSPGTEAATEPEQPSENQSNIGVDGDNVSRSSIGSPGEASETDDDTGKTGDETYNPVTVDDPPAEKRYVSEHRRRASPRWIPEENVSLNESDARAYEVTRYPNVQLTEEHLEAAWSLYNRSYEAARERGFFEFNRSVDAGYRKHDPYHFFNEEYYFNDENLDPQNPEGLVYFKDYIDGGTSRDTDPTQDRILAGYVFFVDSMETEGEQVAGPLTTWYYHPQNEPMCFASRLNVGFQFEGYECAEEDTTKYRTPEMMHVWFIRHPEGPFSTSMGSYEWATDVFETVNSSSAGTPEKMNEEEFKSYARKKYEKYFVADAIEP